MKTFAEISEEIDLYEMTGVAPKTSGLGSIKQDHLHYVWDMVTR